MGSRSSKCKVNLEFDSSLYNEMKKVYGEVFVEAELQWFGDREFEVTFIVTTLNGLKDSLEKKSGDERKPKNKQKAKFHAPEEVVSFWLEEADGKQASNERRRGDTALNSFLNPSGDPQRKVGQDLDSWPTSPHSASASALNQTQETATASSSAPIRTTKNKRVGTWCERPKTGPHEKGQEDGEKVQKAVRTETNMVFQPWSEKDLREAITRLPRPRDFGVKFADELQIFCREFSPTLQHLNWLLLLKLGPTDWQTIGKHFPAADAVRTHKDWNHADNEPYRSAVELLCQHIKTAFPGRVDVANTDPCIQRKDEAVRDFYTRLYETFSEHMRSSFLNGLRPELSTAVKQSCVAWEKASLETVREHAIRAEKQHDGEKEEKRFPAAQTVLESDPPRNRGARKQRRGPRLSKSIRTPVLFPSNQTRATKAKEDL